jgi:hypothetical protein
MAAAIPTAAAALLSLETAYVELSYATYRLLHGLLKDDPPLLSNL